MSRPSGVRGHYFDLPTSILFHRRATLESCASALDLNSEGVHIVHPEIDCPALVRPGDGGTTGQHDEVVVATKHGERWLFAQYGLLVHKRVQISVQ